MNRPLEVPPAVEQHARRCDECGKIIYSRAGARARRAVEGARMRMYRCPAGHGWHLTTWRAPSQR